MNQLNKDRVAVIDPEYHWQIITPQTPRGAKLQLINSHSGVATYGILGHNPGFWTHWAPLPTFLKEMKK